MTNKTERQLSGLGFEAADLDGHSIEELIDYLDADRTPTDPSIEASPGCRLALDALERLRGLTPELRAYDGAAEPVADDGWVQEILAGIALDVRAGRRIPISAASNGSDLGITEGVVRGLIRAAETAVPGVLLGRCQLDGDVTDAGAPVRVRAEASVPYGSSIPALVGRLRSEVAARLAAHTELNVTGIDIAVYDVHEISPQPHRRDRQETR